MKKAFKEWLSCTVAIISLTGLFFTACTHFDVRGIDKIPNNNVFLGSFLNLDEILYTVDFNDKIIIFEQIKDDFFVTSNIGGEGVYSNGQLVFFMDKPSSSLLKPIGYLFVYNEEENYYTFLENELSLAFYHNLSYSEPLARFAILRTLETPIGSFSREYASVSKWEFVVYVYVDLDVTITAEGTTLHKWDTIITDNLNIDFRAGWNAVHYNINFSNAGQLTSVALGNPSHIKWAVLPERYKAR